MLLWHCLKLELDQRGLLFFPRPPTLLAFKISLWVVVRKKFRQDFDNVPKWFIFKCCSPKHQNIKLEQMLLGRIEGLWSHRYGREGGGVGGLWTWVNRGGWARGFRCLEALFECVCSWVFRCVCVCVCWFLNRRAFSGLGWRERFSLIN